MPNLTTSQQKALALDKNISITAGAGSGKTKILVERFLKIVLQDYKKVRRVLAITFTKKAAGEMRERIASDIQGQLSDCGQPAEKHRLLAIRDQLNSVSVSTIHGFCSRVLHEFPLEAGLSPDFSELDDMRSVVLIHEAIEACYSQLDRAESGQEKDQWLNLFISLGRKNVTSMLEKALLSPFDMARIAQRFLNWEENDYLKFLTKNWLKLIQQALRGIELLPYYNLAGKIIKNSAAAPNEKAAKVRIASVEFCSSYENDNKSIDTLDSFISLTDTLTTNDQQPYKNLAHLGGNKSWTEKNRAYIIRLSEMCAEPAQGINEINPGKPPGAADRDWFLLFRSFLRLYNNALEIYTGLKLDQGVVDFEDLQILTVRLLQKNEHVRHELFNRYDFIMVDEFQDTNELQWQIIEALAKTGNELSKDKIFIVGDPKQSIYGFRDADIRIFKNARDTFSRIAGTESAETYHGNVIFEESFRFLPRLNAFINHVFSRILQEDEGNPFEVGYDALRAVRNLPDKGWVELALAAENDDDNLEEADYIAGKIERILSEKKTVFRWEDKEVEYPVEAGDIAVLLRSRNNLLEVEQALRKKNIPFKTAGGVGFWQRQEIYDFYHLLRFISNPQDDFALIGVLRSKMFMIPDSLLFYLANADGQTYLEKINSSNSIKGITKDDSLLLHETAKLVSGWIECRDRMNITDLLQKIINDLRLPAILSAELNGEQLSANAEKLIEQAQHFDQSGAGGLQDFINNMDTLIEREMREGEAQIALDDRDTVKLMTIHAAKGLQFPVVFVPYLNVQPTPNRHDILLDHQLGMAVKFQSSKEDGEGREHTLWNLLLRRRRQKELAEAKRVFYVAATRASNYLFLSGKLKSNEVKKNTALDWLLQGLNLRPADIINSDGDKYEYEGFELDIQSTEKTRDGGKEIPTKFFKEMNKLISTIREYDPQSHNAQDLLLPLKDDVKGQIFSATRIMTFLKDAKEYYKRYHLGFFEQDYETFAADIYQDDPNLLRGKIVHRYLERFRDTTNREDLIERILFEYEIFDSDLRRELRQELTNLENRIQTSPIGKPIVLNENSRNEVSVFMRLGKDYLTGTLDRIFQNDDGMWEVVDYKTNRIPANKVDNEGAKYEYQMKTYALLLSRLYPAASEYPVSLWFLNPDRLYRKIYSRDDMDEIAGFFIDTIDRIKQTFPIIT